MRTNGEGAGDIRPLPRSCITLFRDEWFAPLGAEERLIGHHRQATPDFTGA
jgi:hypothetical protein